MSRVNRMLLEPLMSAMLLMVGGSQLAADEQANSPQANSPAEVSFFGGGWDANGPAMSGTHVPAPADPDADAPTSDLPHGRRGGWDGNGSALVGTNTAALGADELNLDSLKIERVTPPRN